MVARPSIEITVLGLKFRHVLACQLQTSSIHALYHISVIAVGTVHSCLWICEMLSRRLLLPDALQNKMQAIYDIPDTNLLLHAEIILQHHLDPLRDFITSLPPDGNEISLILRASLLLYTVTDGTKVPR
jgi:hypothetical protein